MGRSPRAWAASAAFLARRRVLQSAGRTRPTAPRPGRSPGRPARYRPWRGTPRLASAGHALPRPGCPRRRAGRRRPGRPAAPRRCGPGRSRRVTRRIRIRPAGTPWLRLQQVVQDRQAAPRLPGQDQGHAQAGRRRRIRGPGPRPCVRTGGVLELLDRLADIAEVPEDHAGGLVRHRGLRRRGFLASTSRAAARASDGRDSARASSLSGSQAPGTVSESDGILRIVFSASAFRRDQLSESRRR